MQAWQTSRDAIASLLAGQAKTKVGHGQSADLQVHYDLCAGVVQDGLEWFAGGGAQVVKACGIVVLDYDWHAGHGGLQGGRAVVVGVDPAGGQAGASVSRDCREGTEWQQHVPR